MPVLLLAQDVPAAAIAVIALPLGPRLGHPGRPGAVHKLPPSRRSQPWPGPGPSQAALPGQALDTGQKS